MPEEKKDTRVVMYREGEAREFPSPDAIPKDEGWVDHPDKAAAKPKPAPGKKKAAPAPEPEEDDGDE